MRSGKVGAWPRKSRGCGAAHAKLPWPAATHHGQPLLGSALQGAVHQRVLRWSRGSGGSSSAVRVPGEGLAAGGAEAQRCAARCRSSKHPSVMCSAAPLTQRPHMSRQHAGLPRGKPVLARRHPGAGVAAQPGLQGSGERQRRVNRGRWIAAGGRALERGHEPEQRRPGAARHGTHSRSAAAAAQPACVTRSGWLP